MRVSCWFLCLKKSAITFGEWCRAFTVRLTLQSRHNEHVDFLNHRRLDCLLNWLFRRRSKKIWKLCVIGLCEGNPPVTGGFPLQRASNAEKVFIWWRHPVRNPPSGRQNASAMSYRCLKGPNIELLFKHSRNTNYIPYLKVIFQRLSIFF